MIAPRSHVSAAHATKMMLGGGGDGGGGDNSQTNKVY
jgi:hypothetical protein